MALLRTFTQRNVTITVSVQGEDEIERNIKQMMHNLRDLGPYHRTIRRLFLETVRQRFLSGGGRKQWAPLSIKSTIPLRLEGITRMIDAGGKPRLGGMPIRTLRTAFHDYISSWLQKNHRHHVEKEKPDALKGEGRLTIINRSPKTVHESGLRSIRGFPGFQGKVLPARPVGWIEGDDVLIGKLFRAFDEHIWKDLRKSYTIGETTLG